MKRDKEDKEDIEEEEGLLAEMQDEKEEIQQRLDAMQLRNRRALAAANENHAPPCPGRRSTRTNQGDQDDAWNEYDSTRGNLHPNNRGLVG